MVTGAALATVNRLPVLLLPGDVFASRRPGPGAPAARGPCRRRRFRQRLLPAGLALLRPDLAARAADPGGAAGHARAREPGRDGRGDARLPAGRADRGVRLPGRVPAQAGLARAAAAAGRGLAGAGGGADPGVAAAPDRRRRRRHLLGGDAMRCAGSASRRESRSGRPRQARARCPTTTPRRWARSA